MMAKKIQIALALMLVLAMVTACTDSGEVKQPANVKGNSSINSANTNESTSDPDSNSNGADDKVGVTIAETVLYNADGIVVTVTGYEEGWMGPEVKVLIENNSTKNVLISTDLLSVNGYMMPYGGLYAEVAAGKKSNESLSLSSSELRQSSIETIAEIQFYIEVLDADTWLSIATSDLLAVNTSAVGFEQPVDDSGDVIVEDNGIKIVCKGLKQDILWDGTIVFYIENNSGVPITVYSENVSVNGFMEDASLWADLREGTRIVDGMSLLNLSDLELASIDEVKNIEFNLCIINAETWDEIMTTDIITLNFE